MTGDEYIDPIDEGKFAALLVKHRRQLIHFLDREAGGLKRWESSEDLAQVVHMRALAVRARLMWRGEVAFRRWIEAIAKQVVADRHDHWRALKRDAGYMIRITAAGPVSEVMQGVDPADLRTGPVTFSMRRESLSRAALALSTLGERDGEILHALRDGLTTEEIAQRIGLEVGSAQRAIHRARERFERAYELLGGK